MLLSENFEEKCTVKELCDALMQYGADKYIEIVHEDGGHQNITKSDLEKVFFRKSTNTTQLVLKDMLKRHIDWFKEHNLSVD